MGDKIVKTESASLPASRVGETDIVRAFLAGRNERTQRAYQADLDNFSTWLGVPDAAKAAAYLFSCGLGEANRTVLSYRAELVERGLSNSTINRRLAAIRSMVKLARTLGVVPWTLEIPSLRGEPCRDTRGPGVANVRAILGNLKDRKDPKGIRDVAIIRLLYDLGLRRGEVTALDVEDMDLEAGTLDVMGKGRTQKETLTIPEATRAALADWMGVHGESSGPLFYNFNRSQKGARSRITGTGFYLVVRALGEKMGIKNLRPHGFRHTSITEACKRAQAAGISLEEVMEFSRHKDIRTLMVYRDREKNRHGEIANLVAAGV